MGINISVTGDKGEVKNTLRKLFAKDKYEFSVPFVGEGILAYSKFNQPRECDILVAHASSSSNVVPAHIAVVNSDDATAILSANRAQTIITYGFNNQACVTASGLSQDTMQVCIQRSLPCVNGKVIEQQEFALPLGLGEDPAAALAATAAALISGVEPGELAAAR